MSKVEFIHKEQILPEAYKPTEQILLCSNKISGYSYLFGDYNFYPILIGKGIIPRIWLYAKLNNNDVITLVEDTVSNLDRIKVDIYHSENRIEIKDTETKSKILELYYSDFPVISKLDLRPIGYNIYGNSKELKVGTSSVIQNHFKNVHTIIGLNDKN